MKKSKKIIVGVLIIICVSFVWYRIVSDNQKKINADASAVHDTERGGTVSIEHKDTNEKNESLDYTQVELPTISQKDVIIRHFAYTLCYNEKYEQASWVAYELTANEIIKRYDRTNRFLVDHAIQSNSADDQDYKKSGFDRGHLAPAGDMSWSATAMEESFYYSNMSPQDPSFNRGIWKKLEEQVRSWAGELGTVYVVTGPVLKGKMASIGHNDVAVPNYYYKVILDTNEKNPKAIGFILRNEGSKSSLSTFAVSIDSVENFTGIDFFPGLSDKLEQQIEQTICSSCWNWSVHKNRKNNSNTNSTAVQCSGTTKKGLRCKRMTKDASGKCYQHD
jgi:endonuclease G